VQASFNLPEPHQAPSLATDTRGTAKKQPVVRAASVKGF
jgi:hypothetical protein